jgi:hypothetical protein
MKSVSDVLNKTPWWALLIAGLALMFAIAAFVTPYHIIDYRTEGATPAERQAIKREIDNAFAENAIDLARNVIVGMSRATKDEARREELAVALEGLEEARRELRDAGSEVLRAKREALEQTREAARNVHEAVAEARREVERVMNEGGVQNEEVRKSLEESLRKAKQAEDEAKKELDAKQPERKRVKIGLGAKDGKPLLDTGKQAAKTAPGAAAPVPPKPPVVAAAPRAAPPAVDPLPPIPPLTAEERAAIRHNVTGDMYRIGIGAALALIVIPLFILAIFAKFFIDRSRAAQRMADLKRKEAEYHRMSQQVTEAKLQALQAQVEPHFLYNTLASVQALTEVDPAQANAMTGHLIQYLRSALPKMREGVSTVGQEVELVRAYLSILQMRMGKRLTFDIAVPASLSAIPFPPLMLPSLVENAIKHGLEPLREGGSVHISAQMMDGKLRLTVADSGRGFGESIGAGVGLANIRERLEALYGGAAKLTLEANTPKGVIATIEVPMEAGRPGASPSASTSRASATPEDSGAPAAPAAPQGAARRTLAAMGSVERVWRKGLSFTFLALVIVAAVAAGLGIFGVATGMFPVQMGDETISGPGGALIGAVGILLAFVVVVIAIAILVAVIYGMGFLMIGVLVFVLVTVVIAIAPVLAPFVIAGLAIWWIFRKKKKDEAKQEAAARVEPSMAAATEPPMPPMPPSGMPPPVPPADRAL